MHKWWLQALEWQVALVCWWWMARRWVLEVAWSLLCSGRDGMVVVHSSVHLSLAISICWLMKFKGKRLYWMKWGRRGLLHCRR